MSFMQLPILSIVNSFYIFLVKIYLFSGKVHKSEKYDDKLMIS